MSVGKRISIAALPLVLLVALGLAACGGTSDVSGSAGSLSLIAYSTPQEAYEEIIPAFKETDDGKGVGFKQSYGASGDQARAVEAGLNADVVALSLAPDVDKLVEAKKVAAELEQGRVRRLRDELGGGAAHPRGQPQEHPNLGRPAEGRRRGDPAEPVHLGRREVEHHGRLRRPARGRQVRAGGQGVPARAVQARARCRTRAPARRCRRSSAARATCCSPTRTRRSRPSRRARRSTT